jgi:hypothetical protein
MSVTNEPEPVGAHGATHDTPQRLREEPERRLAAADGMLALREMRPETVGRTIYPTIYPVYPTIYPVAPLDSQMENGISESLRPLDLHAMNEIRAMAHAMEQRGTLFGVAGPLAAAVGVSAIIALFFAIMMPAAWQRDTTPLFTAAVQPFTTALSRQHQSEAAPKPALAEFQSLLASGGTAQAAEREQPEKDADKLLQQFLQWRQKAAPRQAAQ